MPRLVAALGLVVASVPLAACGAIAPAAAVDVAMGRIRTRAVNRQNWDAAAAVVLRPPPDIADEVRCRQMALGEPVSLGNQRRSAVVVFSCLLDGL